MISGFSLAGQERPLLGRRRSAKDYQRRAAQVKLGVRALLKSDIVLAVPDFEPCMLAGLSAPQTSGQACRAQGPPAVKHSGILYPAGRAG